MRQRVNIAPIGEKRFLDVNELCAYLSCGRNRAVATAKEIGCEISIGRRKVYDLRKLNSYFDKITGVK